MQRCPGAHRYEPRALCVLAGRPATLATQRIGDVSGHPIPSFLPTYKADQWLTPTPRPSYSNYGDIMIINWTDDITSAIIGSTISFPLGIIGGLMIDPIRTRRNEKILREAWGFLKEKTYVFVPAIKSSHGISSLGGYGDMLALANVLMLSNKLAETSSNLVLCTDAEQYEIAKQNNIISIGGSKYNRICASLIDELRVPLHFYDTENDNDNHVIRDQKTSITYSSEYNSDMQVVKDVALVVRARNPFNRSKWIVIAIGSHTFGTAAAIEYLTNPLSVRELRGHLETNVECIVQSVVKGNVNVQVSRVSNIIVW